GRGHWRGAGEAARAAARGARASSPRAVADQRRGRRRPRGGAHRAPPGRAESDEAAQRRPPARPGRGSPVRGARHRRSPGAGGGGGEACRAELERELQSVEGERDEALLVVQDARTEAGAEREQRERLAAELVRKDAELADSLSEEERLAGELERFRDDSVQLKKSVE